MAWFIHYSSILLFILVRFQSIDAARKSHYVHWNTSNPIFRIDNTDHIIDVNRGNQPWEYDQVNIICPYYHHAAAKDDIERYIIYSVSKDEYDSCRISSPNPRVIAQCMQPHELMYFTITFRSFTPTPGGMEFKPGKDYYFISTSSNEDLHRRVGGKCSTHNMKVQFKVADNQHESHPPNRKSAVNVPRPPIATLPTNDIIEDDDNEGEVSTKVEIVDLKQDQDINYYGKRPMFYGDLGNYDSFGRNVGDFYNDKKRAEYEVHPNDIVKHEASRMAATANGHVIKSNWLFICLVVLSTFCTLCNMR